MKYALIIGSSEYEDVSLTHLKTPVADTHALADVLRDKKIGAFDKVILMDNQTEPLIRRAISTFFADKHPDDLLLFYFSGHGILDDKGRLYLAAKDTQRSLLKATAINSSFITDEMDSCRSKRQILILDCCHSGAFARGAKGDQTAVTEATFEGAGYGRVVLTASDSTQFAFEGDQVIGQVEHSLFTHYLLQGLTTGAADADNDGKITLDEWYDYAYTQTVNQTSRQTPRKWSYNQQGEMIIAQNLNLKPVKPAQLSAELIHALESPFVNVRMGALEELNQYLNSKSPDLVLAARAAMEKLSDDDSKRVSTTVSAYLAEYAASKQPNESSLMPTSRLLVPTPMESIKSSSPRPKLGTQLQSILKPKTWKLHPKLKLQKQLQSIFKSKVWQFRLTIIGILGIQLGSYGLWRLLSTIPTYPINVPILILEFVFMGVAIGVLQWIIIRQYAPKSIGWIIVNNVIPWLAGAGITLYDKNNVPLLSIAGFIFYYYELSAISNIWFIANLIVVTLFTWWRYKRNP